jgi:hypothetical protein
MSYLSFGSHLNGYNTFKSAIRMCFAITVGEFDFMAMYGINPTMAVIFFFPFNMLFVFVLTNIFLAIINQSYKEASNNARQ